MRDKSCTSWATFITLPPCLGLAGLTCGIDFPAGRLRRANNVMQSDQIKAQLNNFIRTRFNVPPSDKDFNDDIHLFDYGYIDSFGAVELTTFVEKQFAIRVSPSDLVAFPLNTINEISSFVERRKKGEI